MKRFGGVPATVVRAVSDTAGEELRAFSSAAAGRMATSIGASRRSTH